jgi:hypothetical protein
MRTHGNIQYAVIKTQHGILTYLKKGSSLGWTNDFSKARLFPNEAAAKRSVISVLKDFNTKRFIDGVPAT